RGREPQHEGNRRQAGYQRQNCRQPPHQPHAETESSRRRLAHPLRARGRLDRTEEDGLKSKALRRRAPWTNSWFSLPGHSPLMNLLSKKLSVVLAAAACFLGACSKKPARPDPSATVLG